MTENTDDRQAWHGVLPYLAVQSADKAIEFYARAFAAELHGEVARAQDGRILNAALLINKGMIMLMDAFPEIDMKAGQIADGRGLTMQLMVEDADLWWDRAVAAGCTVTVPLKLEFWGDRYGRLQDAFGIDWAINEPAARH